jgi:hypothetical protein
MEWAYDRTPKENDATEYVYRKTKNSTLSKNVGRMMSLYDFLHSRKFESPKEIQNSVFYDSAHKQRMFSPKQSATIFKLLAKSGGGGEVFDKILRRASQLTPEFIQEPLNAASPWIFILKTLESNEQFGPFLSIALDSATHSLPVIAAASQNLAPEIIGLVPIPEAGPIGAVIGWAVASIFTFFCLIINVSREHFDEAFINSFLLIPFIGSSLHNAAMKGDDFLSRTAEKRNPLIKSVKTIPLLGTLLGDVLESIIPDLDYDPNDPEHVQKAAEIRDRMHQGLKEHGSNLMSKIKDHPNFQQLQAHPKFQQLSNMVAPHVKRLTNGGKRFSTLRHTNNKWKTLRKKFVKH